MSSGVGCFCDNIDLSSSSIVVREDNTFKRRIREAIEIHCQAPTLNHDVGYELLAIYRDALSHVTVFYQLNHVVKTSNAA